METPCLFSSRRQFLAGLAAGGAATLLRDNRLLAQSVPRLINVHHHLTAPAYVKFLTENKVREFPAKSAAESIEDMDKAGVTIALCSTIGPGIWMGKLEETRRLAREINDYAAKVVSDYRGRFGMFTMLPLPDIDASLKEIEYGFDKLRADGVYMYTNWGGKALYGDKYLGDAALAPIYEELNRRKAIVYTHPKDAACCEGIIPGVGSGTIEYPMDTARTIVSLLYSGTAARYPEVRFIFSHGGGALTGVIGRIAGAAASYLQDGGTLRAGAPAPRSTAAMPKGPLYELQKFYYDTSSAVNPVGVGGLRKIVPLSQIMFGGDFPFVVTAEQVMLLKECKVFNDKELKAIFSENTERLFPRLKKT
ncbi:MAG: amidohydrolase [Terriglobia bacterium]|nr:MAG: amidohydrolase [Terriglobia bacterium]